MRIALDYDGTYTADPALWQDFVECARARGHEVVCVTMRREQEAIVPLLSRAVNATYYTSRRAKGPFMDALGIHIDVWIDDSPHWITRDLWRR